MASKDLKMLTKTCLWMLDYDLFLFFVFQNKYVFFKLKGSYYRNHIHIFSLIIIMIFSLVSLSATQGTLNGLFVLLHMSLEI